MKPRVFPVLAVVAAAGCSDAERVEPVPTSSVTEAQRVAFDRLEATTGKEWRWLQHDTLGTPLHLSAARIGAPVLVRGADPVATTLGVLSENRALFRMREPGVELAVKKTETDTLGMTHARFQQLTHGVPVAGAEVMAHYDRDGHLASIDASYVADLDGVDVDPAFDADAAREKIVAEIVEQTGATPDVLEPGDATLAVVGGRLAYQLTVRAVLAATPAVWKSTLDAKTGVVVKRVDDLRTVQGSGTSVLGKSMTFEVAASGTAFVMTDSSGGAEVKTYTAKQRQATPGTQVTSTSATSWDTGVTGAGAAVDAHVNAAAVLKYYKTVHQRNAIDGVGGALLSTVHFSTAYENAAWDGSGMFYGDGATLFKPLSAAIDVVGHEFTHGVTQATSALVYEDQAGALNEAISDMFGCFIEHSVTPDATANWHLGELIVKSGQPLRDMTNPGLGYDPQPAHMSEYLSTQQDSGGVHTNSGIVNNAGWLMTMGGTNPVSKVNVALGLGWEKSEQLWYRANTKYFQSTTNFAQAAQGLLQSAKDLGFTTNEQNIVDCAFKAVGVTPGTCATITDPTVPTAATTTSTTETTDGTPASGDDGASAAVPVRRRAVVTTSGCNAAGTSHNGGIFLLLGLLAIATRRKKG